jgi:general stress protein YciG
LLSGIGWFDTSPDKMEWSNDMTQEKSNRGFASMDEEKQREIARKGGQSVPDEERSFSKDRELASEAGRKGGHESGGSRNQSR